jgi:glucosyl-3-phosphoglycerate phosphatase
MQLVPRTDRPRRLVLLRHGRTEWNRIGRAQGHADVSLDALGRAQAKQAAGHLATYEPVFLWSSDLARAGETADELASATGLEVKYDARLREYDVGVRQGMTFGEFEAAYPEIVARFRAGEPASVPGAESNEQVADRTRAVINEAVEALERGDTGILIGHGASLRTGLLAFFDAPPHLREMLAGMSNCAWTVLEQHRDRGWQIIDYNATTLPEPLELPDDMASS